MNCKTISQVLEEFKREFGIHFSPSELQFAEGFIKSSLEAILESMPLEEKTIPLGLTPEEHEEIRAYNSVYNQAVKEVKEWRDFILK